MCAYRRHITTVLLRDKIAKRLPSPSSNKITSSMMSHLILLVELASLTALVACSESNPEGSSNETYQSQPSPSYDYGPPPDGPSRYASPDGPKGVGVQHFDPSQVSTFGIFHNLPEIFNVLKDIRELMTIPQVQDLYQKMLNNQLTQWPREGRDGTPDRRPFVVIEGIKGSGKSATARLYTQRLNGTYLRSPPDYLANIRGMMSMKPRLVRSAYHALNNYLMAELVKSILKTRLVVMDQYWHGLTAFALAKLAGIRQNLPVPGSPIYNFPQDLLMPDLSFFIAANDERRLFKLPDTGKPATSKVFRESTYEAYSLMDLPRMIPINGDRLREEVEAEMVKVTHEQLQGFI